MKTITPFNFATVVCDGCACRVDSTISQDILRDYDDLIDWKLEDCDWERVEENNDEKWYCPDCYQTCGAMSKEGERVENWEEVFCSKCKFKDDCNEIEPRSIPCANLDECNRDCPHRTGTPYNMMCTANADAKCPRVEEWKNEGMAKQEAANAAALAKCSRESAN